MIALQRRRAAGRDGALEHRRLEAVDDRQDELRRRGRHLPQDAQAGVLLALAPAPAGEQPDEEADRDDASGGTRTASAASTTATASA